MQLQAPSEPYQFHPPGQPTHLHYPILSVHKDIARSDTINLKLS